MEGKEIDDYFPSKLDHTNLDLVVFRGSGILLGVTLTASGGNTGCTIRSGVNALGPAKFLLEAIDATTVTVRCPEPVLFNDGLFVDPDDANAYVTVQWAPLPTRLTE